MRWVAQCPPSLASICLNEMEKKMKVLKRPSAIIPCVLFLGFVNAGAALADATSFKVPLTGAQSVPAVDTTGSGTAELTYDTATRGVAWNITYMRMSRA